MITETLRACPADIQALDQQDPLAHLRDAFVLPDDKLYFDGNSLGPLTKASKAHVMYTLEQAWGKDLISSWNSHNWIDLPVATGERIAPLLGAAPGQVIACDSVSVNLYKLLTAAVRLNPGRSKILSTNDNFPTDLYMAAEVAAQHDGLSLELVEPAQLESALDEQVTVLLLTQVNYRSGGILPMDALTRLAHQSGALVLWDLSHSVGALSLELDVIEVDMAMGCGYKYLNGGPGAPAFAYVAKALQDDLRQPLAGWMGHSNPFAFTPDYDPAPGVQSLAAGTPPILSMASLYAALDVFDQIDMHQIRAKSLALGSLCQRLIVERPALTELVLMSPAESTSRGSQLAYQHPQAYAICQALIEAGVIADFRSPDLLRIGFAPLYVRFCDVFALVDMLAEIMASGRYREARFEDRQRVT